MSADGTNLFVFSGEKGSWDKREFVGPCVRIMVHSQRGGGGYTEYVGHKLLVDVWHWPDTYKNPDPTMNQQFPLVASARKPMGANYKMNNAGMTRACDRVCDILGRWHKMITEVL